MRNAENGTKETVLPREISSVRYQYQMVNLENIHASNNVSTDTDVYDNTQWKKKKIRPWIWKTAKQSVWEGLEEVKEGRNVIIISKTKTNNEKLLKE